MANTTIEEVGEKIRASIREARAEGLRIAPKILRGPDQCCAIGAVIRADTTGRYMEAARVLDIGHGEVVAIARGFDSGKKPSVHEQFNDWFELGALIRREVMNGRLWSDT
jgi:hypothetical protein